MLNTLFIERILLLTGVLLMAPLLMAQEDLWTKELKPAPVYSPQTAEMIRFDNTASELYSGKIDLNIPLISFHDPDFDLSMILHYNSGGFKPSEPDNFVGMNWSLMVGGIIYRDVKGIADDAYRENISSMQPKLRGFLGHPRLNMTNDEFVARLNENPEELLWRTSDGTDSFFENKCYSFPAFAGTNVEASSDIYHYNFGKYSGDFLINFDGSVSVAPHNGGNVEIDLNGYQYDMDSGTNGSVLKIITDDGYVYCFGGSYSAMEYTALSWQNEFGRVAPPDPGTIVFPSTQPDNTNEVSAFHLFRIIAPNGRELVIDYMDGIPAEYHKNPNELFLDNRCEMLVRERVNEHYVLSGAPISTRGYGNVADRGYSLNKVALVKDITTDDKIVRFYYSYPGKNNAFSVDDVRSFGQSCRTRLDSVCLCSRILSGSEIESCYMKYQYRDNRMFLSELSHSKTGKYGFSYNNRSSLPGPMTINIDHWKYWRGAPRNTSLVPQLERVGLTNDVKILSADREPTGDAFDAGLLTSVSFPTGGRTSFEYEPHTYNRVLDRTHYALYTPQLLYADEQYGDKMAGGARIRKITHLDGHHPLKETTYCYNQGRNSSKSSGILMYMPHYGNPRHSRVQGGDGQYVTTLNFNSNGFGPATYASEHVRYSTVMESDFDLAIVSKPDSSFRLNIGPMDDLRKKVFTLRVGEMGDVESKAVCTIKGYGLTNTTSRITIGNIKEYVFSASTHQEEFQFKLSELPTGSYQVRLSADYGAYVSIQLNYPNGYTRVEGACKVTKFTDYHSHPDTQGAFTFSIGHLLNSCVIKELDEQYVRNFLADPISLSHARGKVREELYYDQSGDLIKHIYNTYGTCNSALGTYIQQPPMYAGTQFGVYSKLGRVILSPYALLQKQTWEWFGGRILESVRKYSYDDSGYLKKEEIAESDGSSRVKTYTYSAEKKGGNVYDEMARRNMRGYITDESIYAVTPEDGVKDRESMSRDFRLSENIHGQDNIPVVSSVSCSTGDSLLEVRSECLRHDAYGNPVYILDDGSSRTVCLWGCKGKHMIARIENASYDEVCQALNGQTPEAISLQNAPDMELINALREKLLEARIHTYTYQPLVGMLSMTAPNGETMYYEYDPAGRLQEKYRLENGVRKIIEHTEYHYVNN